MGTPDQNAAQIRSSLPIIEQAMAIIGIKPPDEWQQLKELLAVPPDAALTKAAQGWAEVKRLVGQGSTEFGQRSAATPAAWDSPAGAATTASLAALHQRQRALSANCDDAIANLLGVIKAFVLFLLMILPILLPAVIGALFIIATFWAAPVTFTVFAVIGLIAAVFGITHEWNVFQTTISNQCHSLDALTTQLDGPSTGRQHTSQPHGQKPGSSPLHAGTPTVDKDSRSGMASRGRIGSTATASVRAVVTCAPPITCGQTPVEQP